MKGTEKQIIWAESIRDSLVKILSNLISDAAARVADKNMPQEWLTVTTKYAEEVINNIKEIDNASQIIDLRNKNLVATTERKIRESYQS